MLRSRIRQSLRPFVWTSGVTLLGAGETKTKKGEEEGEKKRRKKGGQAPGGASPPFFAARRGGGRWWLVKGSITRLRVIFAKCRRAAESL